MCSCSSLPVLLPGEILFHRGDVRATGDPQRSAERPPSDCPLQTLGIAMQPCTPPRERSRCVDGHDTGAVPSPVRTVNSDNPKQFDGQLSISASDAGPHRSTRRFDDASLRPSRCLALDHRRVYRHCGAEKKTGTTSTPQRSPTAPWAGSGLGSFRPAGVSAEASSLRISIRQPVSLAANRAFCPSLPIASES